MISRCLSVVLKMVVKAAKILLIGRLDSSY